MQPFNLKKISPPAELDDPHCCACPRQPPPLRCSRLRHGELLFHDPDPSIVWPHRGGVGDSGAAAAGNQGARKLLTLPRSQLPETEDPQNCDHPRGLPRSGARPAEAALLALGIPRRQQPATGARGSSRIFKGRQARRGSGRGVGAGQAGGGFHLTRRLLLLVAVRKPARQCLLAAALNVQTGEDVESNWKK